MNCRKYILIFTILSLTSCGGGSSSDSVFSVDLNGSWTGDYKQLGCIACNDGNVFCSGIGTGTDKKTLDITTEPISGAAKENVTVTIDSCTYTGIRSIEDAVTLVSSDTGCSGLLNLEKISTDSLDYSLGDSSLPKAPPVLCTASYGGTATRN